MEILDRKNYTIFLNSNDKVSGTNNNATFLINWDDFLPRYYSNYKMIFTFQTVGGYYVDYMSNQTTSFTASIALNGVMTLLAAPPSGLLLIVGMVIAGAGITAGTTITALGTGLGGIGTYQLSVQTVPQILNAQLNTATPVFNGSQPITYNSAKVVLNNLGRSYSFDTATKCPSYTLGLIQRDIQVSGTGSTSASNTLSCFYLQNPPKTIARPNQNMMTVSIYNTSYSTPTLLTTTDYAGNTSTYGGPTITNHSVNPLITDMTPWQMIIDVIPIEDSLIVDRKGI